MNRREFLRTGAATGVSTAGLFGAASCASRMNKLSRIDRAAMLEMNSYLAGLDESLAQIDKFSYDPDNPRAEYDHLGRTFTRSLAISSMFRDLPLEGQLHPGMQQRIWRSMIEMDDAVYRDCPTILQTGLAEDPMIEAAIKSQSNPGLTFLEKFDRQAGNARLSGKKRFRLRSIGMDAVQRMRRQSPSAVFTEAYDKALQMRRVVEGNGSVEETNRRATIMRLGHRAYEEREREINRIIRSWDEVLVASNDPRYAPRLNLAGQETASDPSVSTPPTDSPDNEPSQSTDTTKPCPACPEAPPCEQQTKLAYEQGFAAGKALTYEGAIREARLEGAKGLVSAGAWTLGVAGAIAAVGVGLVAVQPVITIVMSGTIGGALLITGLIILSVGYTRKKNILKESAKPEKAASPSKPAKPKTE